MTGKSLTLVFGVVLASMPVAAHHNPAAHYIVNERIEVEGVVTEFRPVNPHSRIYFDVTNEQGETEPWMAEGDSIINLRRVGWADDEFKPGDRIRILGRPSRTGRNLIEWTFITQPDGTEVGGGNGQLGERLRYIKTRLAEYRSQRGR